MIEAICAATFLFFFCIGFYLLIGFGLADIWKEDYWGPRRLSDMLFWPYRIVQKVWGGLRAVYEKRSENWKW